MRKTVTLLILGLLCSLYSNAQLSKTVESVSGKLSSLFTDAEVSELTDLTITGTIDARDFTFMRDKLLKLQNLDMSAVTIEMYTGTEGPVGIEEIRYGSDSIPNKAFFNSSAKEGKNTLLTVTMPNSLLDIGAYAFEKCINLQSVYLNEGLLSIRAAAFRYCNNLTYLKFPSTLTFISSSVFYDCEWLRRVILPEGIDGVKKYTYKECDGARFFYIPSTALLIEENAMVNMNSLKELYVMAETPPSLESGSGIYDIARRGCVLYVPLGAADKYASASGWSGFSKIVEISEEFDLSVNEFIYGFDGGSDSFSLETERAWKISTDATWLTFSNYMDYGTDTVTITASRNLKETSRSAKVFIKLDGLEEPLSLSVIQYPSDESSIVVDSTELNFSCNRAGKTIEVLSGSAWTSSTDAAWIFFEDELTETADSLTLFVEKNPLSVSRTDSVLIENKGGGSQWIIVNQGAFVPYIQVLTDTVDVQKEGDTIKIAVESNADCNVSTADEWIELLTTNGSENYSIEAVIHSNDPGYERTGKINLLTEGLDTISVVINQAAPEHYLDLSVDTVHLSAEQDSFAVKIASNTTWKLYLNTSWLSTKTASGSGNAEIMIYARPNMSASERAREIFISGKDAEREYINVIQARPDNYIEASPSNIYTIHTGETIPITVASTLDWTATSDQPWAQLSATSGTGDADLYLEVADTSLTVVRKATVVFLTSTGLTDTIKVQQGYENYIAIDPVHFYFDAGYYTDTLTIISNTDWTIAASSLAWFDIEKKSGTGNAKIPFSVHLNENGSIRKAVIPVSSVVRLNFVINQTNTYTPYLSVDIDSISTDYKGTDFKSFEISSNTKWSVSLKNEAPWVELGWPKKIGNQSFEYMIFENTTTETRTDTIVLSAEGLEDVKIPIVQAPKEKEYVSVSDTVISFSHLAKTDTMFIESNTAWTLSENADWLSLSKTQGTGNDTVLISASANNSAQIRSADITVEADGLAGQTVSVSQTGSGQPDLYCNLSKDVITFGSELSTDTLFIEANTAWTLSEDADWLSLSKTQGTGNDTVLISASVNNSAQLRSADITVEADGLAGQTVSVSQTGSGQPDLYCILSKDVITFGSELSTDTLFIEANTAWTLSEDADWLSLSKTQGTGNDTVLISASANTSAQLRSADITVEADGLAGQTVSVSQTGSDQPDLYCNLSKDVMAFTSELSTDTVFIESNTAWTLSEDADWLSLSKTQGTGNDTVLISASANNSAQLRSADITVEADGLAGQTVSVSQTGSGQPALYCNLSKDVITFGSELSSDTVFIEANTAWTLSEDADWLSLSKTQGTGNDTVLISASANDLVQLRSADIAVSAVGFSEQTISVSQENKEEPLRLATESRILSFKDSASYDTLIIDANTDWNIEVSGDWISLSSNIGNGQDTIIVSVLANTLSTPRTDSITVYAPAFDSVVVTVSQLAAGIDFDISATEFDFRSGGGERTLNITANTAWKLESDASWLTISDTSGTGNAQIEIEVARNGSSDDRTARIAIVSNGVTVQIIEITQTQKVVAVESSSNIDVTVCPNPAENELYVKSQFAEISDVHIIDATGRIVGYLQNSDQAIDISRFVSGLYKVIIITDKGTVVKTIVKE